MPSPLEFPRATWQDDWFHYWVRSHPHHTDYAGIVWHGTYLTWMEEARVECLRSKGANFADLVALGCDLPVVDLAIRYRQSAPMGTNVLVRTQLLGMQAARIRWNYELTSGDRQIIYATATVDLVCVNHHTRKIMRRLPPALAEILAHIPQASSGQ